MKITLMNKYHGTETTINTTHDGVITKSQYNRAKRKLCGAGKCACGYITNAIDSEGNYYYLEQINVDGDRKVRMQG